MFTVKLLNDMENKVIKIIPFEISAKIDIKKKDNNTNDFILRFLGIEMFHNFFKYCYGFGFETLRGHLVFDDSSDPSQIENNFSINSQLLEVMKSFEKYVQDIRIENDKAMATLTQFEIYKYENTIDNEELKRKFLNFRHKLFFSFVSNVEEQNLISRVGNYDQIKFELNF